MKAMFLALFVALSLPSFAYALDYEDELKLNEKIDAFRGQDLTRDSMERLAIVYISQYYATTKPGRRGDRMIYALDELYHERLEEILQLYIQDIADVNLEAPGDNGLIRLANYLVKVAKVY